MFVIHNKKSSAESVGAGAGGMVVSRLPARRVGRAFAGGQEMRRAVGPPLARGWSGFRAAGNRVRGVPALPDRVDRPCGGAEIWLDAGGDLRRASGG